jgi:hypothetical protein
MEGFSVFGVEEAWSMQLAAPPGRLILYSSARVGAAVARVTGTRSMAAMVINFMSNGGGGSIRRMELE